MSVQDNKAVAERFNDFIADFFAGGSIDAIDQLVAPNLRNHGPGLPPDLAGLKQALPGFRAALSNFHMTTDLLFGEGDLVVDRVTWTATHSGDLMGVPPSGKDVKVTEMHISRVQNGKIVERWSEWDMMGLMQQAGAMG